MTARTLTLEITVDGPTESIDIVDQDFVRTALQTELDGCCKIVVKNGLAAGCAMGHDFMHVETSQGQYPRVYTLICRRCASLREVSP